MIDGDEYVLSPAYEALSRGLNEKRSPVELAVDLANAADRLTKDRQRLHERIEQKLKVPWGGPFTSDQLQIGGNHLLYDVQMLCNTAALLEDDSRWSWGWQDKTQYMAVVESFLVHARSLMYFLCPPKGYKQSKLSRNGSCLRSISAYRGGWPSHGAGLVPSVMQSARISCT